MQLQHSDLQHLRSNLKRFNEMHSRGSIDNDTLRFQEQRLLLECAHFYMLKYKKNQENVRKTLLDDQCSIRHPPPPRMANYSSMQYTNNKNCSILWFFFLSPSYKNSQPISRTLLILSIRSNLQNSPLMRYRSVLMLAV